MTRYIVRRIGQAIPLLLLISIVVFALMHLIPGGPLAAYENNPNITAEDLARLREELGLNAPLHVQHLTWLGSVVRGDLGYSLVSHRPALMDILERLPNTLYLSLTAFCGALLIAIPIGIVSATRQYSWFDHLMTTIALIGHSMPIFWFGLVLIIIFTTLKNPATGGPPNDRHAKVDELLAKAASDPDLGKCKDMYCQVARIAKEQVPMIFLYHRSRINSYRERLQGFETGNAFMHMAWNVTNWQVK